MIDEQEYQIRKWLQDNKGYEFISYSPSRLDYRTPTTTWGTFTEGRVLTQREASIPLEDIPKVLLESNTPDRRVFRDILEARLGVAAL